MFLFSLFFTNISNSANKEDIYKKIDLFSEVLDKINKEYVEEVNQSEIMDAAINGALQSLDPYSAYMTPELYKSMQTETSGKFGGLGIEVGMEAGVIKVISPLDNSPAADVGVKAGDYIVKINDTQVQGMSLTEAVELMRGPVGTDIEITVRRIGEKKAIIFNITREIIKIESVKSKYIEEKTLTGDIFLVNRTALEKVGYYDNLFYGYFADHDLGIRLRSAGYKLILSLGAFSYHDKHINFNYLKGEEKKKKLHNRFIKVYENWARFKKR